MSHFFHQTLPCKKIGQNHKEFWILKKSRVKRKKMAFKVPLPTIEIQLLHWCTQKLYTQHIKLQYSILALLIKYKNERKKWQKASIFHTNVLLLQNNITYYCLVHLLKKTNNFFCPSAKMFQKSPQVETVEIVDENLQLDPKLTINKKSIILTLSSWNLIIIAYTWGGHIGKVS